MAPKHMMTPNIACATPMSTESRRVPRRDVEHCQNDPDNLGWAERLHALEEVRACVRVLVQRAPGPDK